MSGEDVLPRHAAFGYGILYFGRILHHRRGGGHLLKKALLFLTMWITAAICLCGCTSRAGQPPDVELNGAGTFEAVTESVTYSGTFSAEGITFTVNVECNHAAPMNVSYNGQEYTLASGGKSIGCTPNAFPADSIWRTLPGLLRELWADPALTEPTSGGWQRIITVEDSEFVLRTGAPENILILILPKEKGRITLQYNGIS